MTRFSTLAIALTYRQTLYHIIVGSIGQGKSRLEIFFGVAVQWQLP
ncbi:hypothetical protein [Microcoleus sp. N3A4]